MRGLAKLLGEAEQVAAILANLDNGPAYVVKLRLRTVKVPFRLPFAYALGSIITLTYEGMPKSSNLQVHRVTRYGCIADCKPDICFSPRDASVAGDVIGFMARIA
jgi:hypothetical protein